MALGKKSGLKTAQDFPAQAETIVDRAIEMQSAQVDPVPHPPTPLTQPAATSAIEPTRTIMNETSKTFETAAQPAYAMHENVRSFAEKGIEQARSQYDTMKKAAETASSKMESTMSNVNGGVVAFNLKVIEVLRNNANATFDHLTALSHVKSLSEAVELQSTHARKQFDSMGAQTKDLTALIQKVANDASEPVKAAMAVRN